MYIWYWLMDWIFRSTKILRKLTIPQQVQRITIQSNSMVLTWIREHLCRRVTLINYLLAATTNNQISTHYNDLSTLHIWGNKMKGITTTQSSDQSSFTSCSNIGPFLLPSSCIPIWQSIMVIHPKIFVLKYIETRQDRIKHTYCCCNIATWHCPPWFMFCYLQIPQHYCKHTLTLKYSSSLVSCSQLLEFTSCLYSR